MVVIKAVAFKRLLVLRGLKCAKKTSPTHYTTTTSLHSGNKA